jgi:peptidoglycan/LPS O-acetylase OafA/YrhL
LTVKTIKPNEVPNLDLLRSIAVLLVLVEHILLAMRISQFSYLQISWIGVVGVFMFFVHTSLVLMWSLERHPGIVGFYIRRAFRIYPLAIAATLALVLFHIPTMQSPKGDIYFQHPTARNLVANLLLVQDFTKGKSILGVMWSLPPEVQMYVLLPFLFFFLKQQNKLWPLLILWTFAVAALRLGFAEGGLPTCVPYFLPGIIAYVLFARVRPRFPAYLFPLLIAGLFLVFMIHPTFYWSSWLLTLALGLAIPHFRQIQTLWLIRVCHHLAKYSYGIYICHMFYITLGINYLAHYNLAIRLTAVLLPLAVTIVLLYHLLEKPMIDLGARLAQRVESSIAKGLTLKPERDRSVGHAI